MDGGGLDWKTVDHAALLRWMAGIRAGGAKEATLHQAKAAVSAWYIWLMRVGRTDKNPIDMLAPVKLPKPMPKPVAKAKTSQILGGVKQMGWRHEARNRAILEMLYASGVRRGELLALDVTDLRLDCDTPHVVVRRGKGKMDRLALLNGPAVAAIKAYLPIRSRAVRRWELTKEQPLFVSQKGVRLCDKQLWKIVSAAAETLIGEHMSPHQWRHSFATDLLNDGANPYAVKELMGHDRMSSTERYFKVSEEFLKRGYGHHPRT